jgi:chromate reductase
MKGRVMKILAIAGSLRKDSYNLQLAKITQKLVKELDPSIEFRILDWSEVPLFNQDIEFPAPEAVAKARDAVLEADGIWFFTPEYNHAMPGVLKNLIDWLSRPVSNEQMQVLDEKPAAFSGVSPGMGGTIQSQDALVPLLSFLGMNIMGVPRFSVSHIAEQTDENGKLTLKYSMSYLERQAKAFIEYIEKFG